MGVVMVDIGCVYVLGDDMFVVYEYVVNWCFVCLEGKLGLWWIC